MKVLIKFFSLKTPLFFVIIPENYFFFKLPILSCKVPIGQNMHQPLLFVKTPTTIAINEVIIHMLTNIAPIVRMSFPLCKMRNNKNPINRKNRPHLKIGFVKNLETGLFILNLGITISRNAPLGQRFQHQNLLLKKDKTKRNAIIPTTK